MASHARQQYYADWETLKKEAREFAMTDELKQKLDSIEWWAEVNVIEDVKVNWVSLEVVDKSVDVLVPLVIDNLYTVDWDNALSAKQWKILYDYIQNLQSRGRYLSNWNTATWLPSTSPSQSPYEYRSGDYFVVSAIAPEWGTNYKPDWSSYIIGVASTTVETEDVKVTDIYLYDWSNWLLLTNSTREIPIDNALSTMSINPVENRVVTNAINTKQDKLIAWNNIQIAQDGKTISATDTTYSAWTNVSIDANNVISAVDTTYTAWANVQISNENVISATDTVYWAWDNIAIDANNIISATYTAWQGIDITNWVISSTDDDAVWWNITGTLSNQTDLQNALDAKQDNLIAWTNIQIAQDWVTISATDTTYSAWDNIAIDANNAISATYTAWDGINITNGVISNTRVSAEWWNITGTLANQTDLNTVLTALQTDLGTKQAKLAAWDNITIEDVCESTSDMQWPAPDGFHIPLVDEWQGIYDTYRGLGLSEGDFATYLKLPKAGYRSFRDSAINNQGDYGEYWSSSPYESPFPGQAYMLELAMSYVFPQNNYGHTFGCSVRCMKNSPAIPTNDWTVLYQGNWGAWIYHNPTDWLISLSANGTTWYTIMDKNLWASTVYNNGDTLTQANMWNMYQWGNNYWFPSTWTISKTSSTQVDASTYWPWNYYSSDTFIIQNDDWESPINDNLRWWVSKWGSQKCVLTISAQVPDSAEWWNITWTLSNQTDLQNALDAKADDSAVVHKAWNETVTWVKTFTANSGVIDWTPAIITPRLRIDWQTGSNKFKSQIDFWKGTAKKWYLWYFEENNKNRFEFASEQTSIPFYLGLMPWQSNNKTIAITNDGIWRWWTADVFSTDKVFSVIGDLDKRIIASSTAPSSPIQWQVWYDTTNDILKTYDGTNWNWVWQWSWDVVWPSSAIDWHVAVFDWATGKIIKDWWALPEESNTKTFYLSSASDLTNAQAAYDWVKANSWNTALIHYDKLTYVFYDEFDSSSAYPWLEFYSPYLINYWSWNVQYVQKWIRLVANNNVVTQIMNTDSATMSPLNKNNTVAYTPSNDYNPATKKYVDDNTKAVSWVSTTQPSNPVAGSTYYNTTNNVLMVYDWTNWNAAWKTYTAWNGIDITNDVISADTTSGSWAPATTPSYIWQQYVDTTNDMLYVATGTSSSSDWTLVGANTWVKVQVISQADYDLLPEVDKNADVIYLITGWSGWLTVAWANVTWKPDLIINPSGWTAWQLLAKTATGYEWTTVNSATWWNITGTLSNQTDLNTELTWINTSLWWKMDTPSWGTTGQVLTKTSNGYEWANATWWMQLAPDSPLTPKYEWYGTQSQYEALSQYYTDEEWDTVYYTIDD